MKMADKKKIGNNLDEKGRGRAFSLIQQDCYLGRSLFQKYNKVVTFF